MEIRARLARLARPARHSGLSGLSRLVMRLPRSFQSPAMTRIEPDKLCNLDKLYTFDFPDFLDLLDFPDKLDKL